MSEQYRELGEITLEKMRTFKDKVIKKAPPEKAFFAEDWGYKVQYETDDAMVILTIPTEYEAFEAPEVLVHQKVDEDEKLTLVKRSRYRAHPENNSAAYSEELDVYDNRTGLKLSNSVINLLNEEGVMRYKELLDDEDSLGLHIFTEDKYQEIMSVLDDLEPEQIVT